MVTDQHSWGGNICDKVTSECDRSYYNGGEGVNHCHSTQSSSIFHFRDIGHKKKFQQEVHRRWCLTCHPTATVLHFPHHTWCQGSAAAAFLRLKRGITMSKTF